MSAVFHVAHGFVLSNKFKFDWGCFLDPPSLWSRPDQTKTVLLSVLTTVRYVRRQKIKIPTGFVYGPPTQHNGRFF